MTVAVIFWARRRGGNERQYQRDSERMVEVVKLQPGFVDYFSVFDEASREGTTVSFFETEADALAWKSHPEHLVAQDRGVADYYECYRIWVADVSRQYAFSRADAAP